MREFRQFGIEVIGTAAPGADVEVIVLGDRFLRARGLRDVSLHLNSIGDEVVPSGLSGAARRLPRAVPRPARRGLPDPSATRTRCGSSTARSTATRTSCCGAPTITEHLCEPCASHFAGGAGRARRRRGRPTSSIRASCVGSTTTRGRPSSGSRGSSRRTRPAPSTPAVATTAWPRRSVVPRRRAWGSRWASTASCWPWTRRACELPPPRAPRCFVVAIGDEARDRGGPRSSTSFGAAGVSAVRALRGAPAEGAAEDGRSSGQRLRGDRGRARARRRRR